MYKELKRQLKIGIETAPILYIPHYHHELIGSSLVELVKSGEISGLVLEDICEWDLNKGPIEIEDKSKKGVSPEKFELWIKLLPDANSEAKVFLIRSAKYLLENKETVAALQLFAQRYERGDVKDPHFTVILVSSEPVSSLPMELNRIVTVCEVKPPKEEDIEEYLEREKIDVPKRFQNTQLGRDLRKQFVRTLAGLQLYELKQIVRTAIYRSNGFISAESIEVALAEKKNIVRKSGIIEVVDTDESFENIGGLSILKRDLEEKARIYGNLSLAKDYKIPYPKGCLIIGMPGCGKSMIAKSIANKFGVSLLRLDVNRLMGQYVGQSEQNLRLALQTAEAANPCVLWIDEIEKAFAGSSGDGGEGDSLVVRLMGHFLTWMQERDVPVYVVATANGVMRPEFMRKGRFDEVYFVDFPTLAERQDILEKKLNNYKSWCEKKEFDLSELTQPGDANKWKSDALKKIAEAMAADKGNMGGFSGAEIGNLVTMVFERKFVEYLEARKDAEEKKSSPAQIRITLSDFLSKVETLKKSAMCNQKGKQRDKGDYEKSPIEQIRELQERYKFQEASNEAVS